MRLFKKFREAVTPLDYVEKTVAEYHAGKEAGCQRLVKTEWGKVWPGKWIETERETIDLCQRLGGQAAEGAVLDRLGELIENGPPDLRKFAMELVGAIGEAAARPDILVLLANRLGNWGEHGAAQEAVEKLGPAAAQPAFLERALEMLLGPGDSCCRAPLAETLARIGEAAARCPGFWVNLTSIVESYGGPDMSWRAEWSDYNSHHFHQGDFQLAVRRVVLGMGEEAFSRESLHSLAALLREGQADYTRGVALSIVADLGGRAVTPEIRRSATGLLQNSSMGLRATALRVLGKSPPR